MRLLTIGLTGGLPGFLPRALGVYLGAHDLAAPDYLARFGARPEGQADIYWLNAQREILTTSVESSGSNAAAAAPTGTGLVATKSAKKAKVARAGKSKTRAA